MGIASYGKRLYDYWETDEYHHNGLHFEIFTGGLPEYYMGRKYLVIYGYGTYGARTRDMSDDWKTIVRQVISEKSKLGNLGKYEGKF